MASSPTYEPSRLRGPRDDEGARDPGLTPKTAELKNYPALNRAIDGAYPPGSTFKPVTALAAMQEHLVSPYAYLPCTGSYTSQYDRRSPQRSTTGIRS